ncbi:MAG: tRNA glutamyl-Q(34) synthetase GluQRS [Panacagrimonas sp.]
MPIYRGRFAPTPSGPLHRGSLVTALGSYLAARNANGRWLLRIDDLDGARIEPAAESTILRQLEAHGLHWDEAPRRQSGHVQAYEAALQRLLDQGRLYRCRCSRADLALQSLPGPDEAVYAGTCRDLGVPIGDVTALRMRVPDVRLIIEDAAAGPISRSLRSDVGDFILRRRDGQIAYQLACAVDEQAQGVTDVVRGADLLGSSFRQAHVMQSLGLPVPLYHHLPLVLDADGRKLSKQNHAPPLLTDQTSDNLAWALKFLRQSLPSPLARERPSLILDHAIRHWRPPSFATATQQFT